VNSNSGISFGDNISISGSALAAGEGARAQNVVQNASDGRSALAEQVERMIALLDEQVAQGRLSPETADTGREVQRQLSAERPNKFLIQTLLNGIAGGVLTITGVAKAVSAVQEMFSKMF
jgi:hypothetical protein